MSTARTITAQNFRETVEAGGIVVLDFWAPWCGPCRGFAPTFEKAAGDNPEVVFGKINTDEEQQLAAAFEIQSIPTLMIFRDRVLLFRTAGALPPAALADVVAQAKALDMEATPRLKEAQAAYGKAEQGPAAQYAPAELATAKKALDQANTSLESGDRELVDDKATLALVKTSLAESAGRTLEAASQRDAALKELNITRDQLLSKTQEELNREREARNTAESQLAQSRKDLEQYAKVQDVARGTVITLSGGVLFESGKAELLPGAQDQLSRVANFLKSSPRPVVIEGYTDSRGSARSNQALSERRARAVADYLTSQGVPADRINAVGKGASSPVASNATADGRSQNRRVEIVLQQGPATAGSPPSGSQSGLGGSAGSGSEPGTTAPPATTKPETQAPPPTTPR